MDVQTSRRDRATVSVFLPNYNHAHFLDRSIEAVLTQSRTPDEFVVIDDASEDTSIAVIERWLATPEAQRCRMRLEKNRVRAGVVAGMNRAIKEMKGSLVALVSADDRIKPDFLAATTVALDEAPQVAFVSAMVEIRDGADRPGGTRPLIRPSRVTRSFSPNDARKLLRHADNVFLGPATLYRRAPLAALGGFDEALGSFSDGIVQRRLAVRYGFSFIPRILAEWRIHGENYSVRSVANPSKFEDMLARAVDVIAREPEGLFEPDYAKVFARRMRFNAARLVLPSLRNGREGAEIGLRLLGGSAADRTALRLASHLGPMAALAGLVWITLRCQPLSIRRLAHDRLLRLMGN